MRVRITAIPERVELRVVDDGVGFDTSREHPGHLGLRTMKERAETIGATLQVTSATGQGTTVRVVIG